jgi:hypothetical protein
LYFIFAVFMWSFYIFYCFFHFRILIYDEIWAMLFNRFNNISRSSGYYLHAIKLKYIMVFLYSIYISIFLFGIFLVYDFTTLNLLSQHWY